MARDVLVATRLLEPIVAPLAPDYRPVSLADGPPDEVMARIRCLVAQGGERVEPALLDRLPALELIACFGAGHDGVDLEDARSRGLQVSYAPGANAPDVADFALGLILASRRALFAGDAQVRAGRWSRNSRPLTRSLSGARLGVVGFGHIGAALAHRAAALDMRVAWWGPRPKPAAGYPRAESLHALAHDSDILAVCAAATSETAGLISAEVIAALGPQGLLVNIARGSLVDETALREALRSGALGAAALDVYTEEPTSAALWRDVPHTILTPHMAAVTDAAIANMLAMVRANLDAFYAGRPLVTPAY